MGLACRFATGDERTERFDRDPKWDGRNHVADDPAPRSLRQDFGYSRTAHAGGKPGEIGGFITPAAEAAYCAAKIPAATFEQPLSASGTLACSPEPFHVLVGFFNAGTLNEWRTPNTIALRLMGRGDVFYAFVEYATSRCARRRRLSAQLPRRKEPRNRPPRAQRLQKQRRRSSLDLEL